jgi:hypothetical protein
MRLIFAISVIVACVIGLAIGVIIDDMPFFTLERNLSIDDVMQLCVSIIALALGPWLVNKWLDEKRKAKDFLIQELRDYLKIVEELRSYIDKRHGEADKLITSEDRAYLMNRMKTLERHLGACIKQLEIVYKKKCNPLCANMKVSHSDYWKNITEDLLTTNKTFDEGYKKTSDKAYDEHSLSIKMGIFDLNAF